MHQQTMTYSIPQPDHQSEVLRSADLEMEVLVDGA